MSAASHGRLADLHDQDWSEQLLATFGALAPQLRREWQARRAEHGRRDGNLWLLETHELATKAPAIFRESESLEQLEAWAQRLADECTRLGAHSVRLRGLAPPRGLTSTAAQLRAEDPHYWRRVLRRGTARYRDQLMRRAGFVHRRRQCYCADASVGWWEQRTRANLATLAELVAESDHGDRIRLDELWRASNANPALRRAEVLTRMRGLEDHAEREGHVGVFLTITCPSRFHARYEDGRPNPRYDGSTPRDANRYLVRVWARTRAALARAGVRVYGLRIAEPHHDGCPHWHLVLFLELGAGRDLMRIVKRYALADSPREPGARKRRVRFEWIDRSKGSATGYVVKYIAKSIDGEGVGEDLYGNKARAAADRIVAWARTWGVRQFQQIGGPFVGTWREYRRIRRHDDGTLPLDPGGVHFPPWYAASVASSYREFMAHMGGATPGRAQPSMVRHGVRVSRLTGESSPPTNRYGERLEGARQPVLGVDRAAVLLDTRPKFWTTRPAGFAAPRAERAAPDAEGGGPWTRVSNCTRAPP